MVRLVISAWLCGGVELSGVCEVLGETHWPNVYVADWGQVWVPVIESDAKCLLRGN